eukprot:IDg22419t1
MSGLQWGLPLLLSEGFACCYTVAGRRSVLVVLGRDTEWSISNWCEFVPSCGFLF